MKKTLTALDARRQIKNLLKGFRLKGAISYRGGDVFVAVLATDLPDFLDRPRRPHADQYLSFVNGLMLIKLIAPDLSISVSWFGGEPFDIKPAS